MVAELGPPPGFRPTELMTKVSAHIMMANGAGTFPTVNQIVAARLGRKEWVKVALEQLVAEGYVAVEPRLRGAKKRRLLRPFIEQRQDEEVPVEAPSLPGMES